MSCEYGAETTKLHFWNARLLGVLSLRTGNESCPSLLDIEMFADVDLEELGLLVF